MAAIQEMIKKTKIRVLVCASVLTAGMIVGSCTSSSIKKNISSIGKDIKRGIEDKLTDSTWEIYGENIDYQDFLDIDFDSLPKKKIKRPFDLRDKSYDKFYQKTLRKKFILEKIEKMDFVRKEYSKLGADGNRRDAILYYSYKLEKSKGNKDKAKQYSNELLEKFPESYWAEEIKNK